MIDAMRFRNKLLLVFLGVTLITNGISLTVLDRLSLYYLREGYRAKLLSITETVATMLDGQLVRQAQSGRDESSPDYIRLREILRQARAANRRSDTWIKRVFTVMPAPSDPRVLLVGVDAADGPRAARLGEAYRSGDSQLPDINRASVGKDFITDEFGSFFRSSAPIRDDSGHVVGALVVEATAEQAESKMGPIRTGALLSMLLATLIATPAILALSRRVSGPLVELQEAAVRIGKGDFDTAVKVPMSGRKPDEFGVLALAMNEMAAGLKERDRVKTTFAHYVSHQVMDSILSSGTEVKLSGDRRRVTVLFCDIRGFSTISEKLAPEKVVMLLNDYFEAMVEVIFRHNGTLDKFIGDGIMVIFGAPEDDVYQEEHALRAAIEMQRELHKLAEKWAPQGIGIRIGIGINSGPAVVGNIGSSRRMDYTAIGDTVNLASRLESASKDLGVGIVISEYTYNAVRGAFRFREMGSVQVRGRTEPVLTYTPEEI
jgi:adenylate cyclase